MGDITDLSQVLGIGLTPRRPARFGLLQSSPPLSDGVRWEGGFRWRPAACGAVGGIVQALCGPSEKDPPPLDTGEQGYQPGAIWEGYRCTSMGSTADEDRALAEQALDATRSFHLERELWTGAVAASKGWLQAGDALDDAGVDEVTADGGAGIVDAVALIEEGLAACQLGDRGMIHMPVRAFVHAAAADVVRPVTAGANQYTTLLGTPVVPGAGYPGTGPAGEAAATGHQWIMGSSTVYTRLSTVTTLDAHAHRVNDHIIIAEQLAAAYFDNCCRLAADVILVPA